MTSICEPTAYGASFPMNSHPLLGLAAANLGRFSYAQLGHGWAMREHEFPSKMASIPWDMSKGNLDDLYLRTNGLRGVLPHELRPLLGLTAANLGRFPYAESCRPWLGHESHEFPPKWLPSLGTCPKATWMTSICEPTAYGASFPMNSRPLLGLTAANLGHFSTRNGPVPGP